MSTRYWQVGGYNASISERQDFDQKRLANRIAGDGSRLRPRNMDSKGPVELILGIKSSGSSHLLITDTQMRTLLDFPRERPRGQYLLLQDFDSLSPILFATANELANKLSELQPKGGKSGDTSRANKGYILGSKSDGGRAFFEHCRLLYHVLHSDIDFPKFSLGSQPWTRSCRVCAFTFNAFKNDTRQNREKTERPMMLDWGFAEATPSDLQYRPDSALHAKCTQNKYLGLGAQGAERRTFEYGTTTEQRDPEIQECLQELFEISDDGPMILLVFDRERSLNIFKNYKVDVSNWQCGIKGLLFESSSYQPKNEHFGTSKDGYGSRYDGYNQRRYRSRSRSRSPGRKHDHRSIPPERPQSRTSSNPHTYAPVYVVDIQLLYRRLMQTNVASEDIPSVAERILRRENHGWCAGNEAPLLFDIWRSMIAGPPIDDQRVLRESERPIRQQNQPPAAPPPLLQSAPEVAEDDNSGWDPNDMQQTPAAAAAVAAAARGDDSESEVEDDYSDSDFGQSDDE